MGSNGCASSAWLHRVFKHEIRFILHWPKRYKLVDSQGNGNAWKITRGKRSMDHRDVWDARRRCWRKTGILYLPVQHPKHAHLLMLVVSRMGKGREPWYLLTNEPIASVLDAWRVVLAYARRWLIEITFRYSKSELAMESPRLWRWDNRHKLLPMVALVYAFLLSLLDLDSQNLCQWLLRHWCHRTVKRYREFAIPLCRLRSAISRLWLTHPLSFSFHSENSGWLMSIVKTLISPSSRSPCRQSTAAAPSDHAGRKRSADRRAGIPCPAWHARSGSSPPLTPPSRGTAWRCMG